MDGESDVQALVDVDVADIGEAASKKVDEEVGASSGADAERGAAEPLQRQPPLADERARVAALPRAAEPPEDLYDQLVREARVDPVVASHCSTDRFELTRSIGLSRTRNRIKKRVFGERIRETEESGSFGYK